MKILFFTLFKQSNKKSKVKFEVGDRVRITKFKNDPNWTKEIFTMKEILNTNTIN